MRYIFVTGGVMSGLGKGVLASSVAELLSESGILVSMMKIDPYVNVDAGTMNPYKHGEVFVTDDGGETDLDLGTYERFLDRKMGRNLNITTGSVYREVIERERRGDYLGDCVQIIPHVTDEVKSKIRQAASKEKAEVFVVELGGTVGDIEGLPFLEAARQMGLEEKGRTVFMHVAYVPHLETTGENKTKPAQHSVQALREIGIQPDFLVARSSLQLLPDEVQKLALFSSLSPSEVIRLPDVPSIYMVPKVLKDQGVDTMILLKLGLQPKSQSTTHQLLASRFSNLPPGPEIAMVGKYVTLRDSYVSIVEALKHAGAALGFNPKLRWIDAEDVEKNGPKQIDGVMGVMVLPGFGVRGTEGMMASIQRARELHLPFLGICFGMQLSVVEFAREKLHLKANSTELDPRTEAPVIDLLPEQRGLTKMGGTMRLGGADITVEEGTLLRKAYGKSVIRERHRHRYEVNPDYWDALRNAGLLFSAFDMSRRRVEAIEDPSLPFFVGTQFHPEFNSRPLRPSPIYLAFLQAAVSAQRGIKPPLPPWFSWPESRCEDKL
ncbi:MAG: CTP synthase [Thermoprotei archaeon]